MRNGHWQFLAGILALAALLLPASLHAQTHDLRFTYTKGDTFWARVVTEQTMQMDMMGQQVQTKQKSSVTTRNEVTGVSGEGVGTLTSSISRFAMESSAMGMTMKYDSAGPEDANSPQLAMLGTMVGKEVTSQNSPSGRVLQIAGFSQMMEGMMTEGMMGGFESMFDDEAMLAYTSQQSEVLPAHPVAVGDTWETEYAIEVMAPMIVKTTYKLESATDDLWRISFNAVVSENPHAKSTEMHGMKMTITTTGTQSGTVEIKPGEPMPTRQTINQDLRMTTSMMSLDPGIPSGTSTSTLKGTTVTEMRR